MEFSISEKNKKIVIIEGFKFRFQKLLRNDVQRWCCCLKSCKCFFKCENNFNIIEQSTEHNHPKPEQKLLNRQNISNSLKRKAIDDISSKPSKLLQVELKKNDVETIITSDVALIKRNIRYARTSVHPKLPKSLSELHDSLCMYEIKTNKLENFLLVNDKPNGIVGFSTISNLEVLCKVQHIYIDGTFKSCPKFFMQVFTIHGLHNDNYVPLIYFLLQNKHTETYVQIFKHVLHHCDTNDFLFSPTYVHIDFESAIHSAVRNVLPTAQIKGCRFHLGQSWWRKIQSLGLTKVFKDYNSEKSQFLKYLFGLPFLHSDEVEECFQNDLQSILLIEDERINKFIDYIFKTYITKDASFPPNLWAEFTPTTNRTTNSCEAFHSKLNNLFISSHPNIYNFIDVIKDIQSETYIKIRSNRQRKSRQIIEKENYIREKMVEYNNKLLTRFEYVKAVSFKFLPV